ncbi:hypothetical protein [Myxococcus sp. Y35]|uniref:hypothetical protein n=1 Tax=Pseudomyxococcus flavus TaxID=3115648 RepID=UPI003CF24DA4
MTACKRLALLACGSSGLTVAHLPALRAYVRRFADVVLLRLIHGAGDTRRDDAPAALGADRLWEVACAVELPGFSPEHVDRIAPDWKGLGRRAGPHRNELMREAARGYARRGWAVRWVAAHTDSTLGKDTRSLVSLCRAEGWKGRVLILSHDGRVVSEEVVS